MSLYKENYDDLRKRLIKEISEIHDIKDKRLKQIEKDFETLIELLLFSLISDRDNFFAFVIIQMERKIDITFSAPAAVCFKKTYFQLILNPFIMLNFNISEMKAVLIHECYHIFNQHLVRSKKYFNVVNPKIVNIGLDAAINQFIDNLPEGCITLESLKTDWKVKTSPIEKEREAEYYISLLREEYNNNEEFKDMVDQMERPEDEYEQSDSGDDQAPNKGSGNDQIAKEQDMAKVHDSWQKSDQTTGDNDANFQNVVKEMANEAQKNARGTIPYGMEKIIKKLNEPPIVPWQNVLKHFVGTVPVPYKYTIMRRDRRQPHRFDLQGKINDMQVEIIVAIDTSGSVSDHEIEYCINEVFDIVKNSKSKVTIIECDADIQKVYEAKKPSDVKPEVKGRGGTAFEPVIEWINSNNKRNAVLIYFTDGGGERTIQRPKCHRLLWVITRGGEDNLSLEEPYGKIKLLDLDEKWKKRNNK
jgi:predicted metal-dependent peptidase